MEKSLVIVKPDGIQRQLVGEIINRFERKGLKIAGLKMMRLDEAIVREHYAHHAEKSFFPELSKYMRSTPVVIVALEGPNAVEIVRAVAGIKTVDLGSIRGDYGMSKQKNIIHSSDSLEASEQEIPRFFHKDEIFVYDRDDWAHVFADYEVKQ